MVILRTVCWALLFLLRYYMAELAILSVGKMTPDDNGKEQCFLFERV